MTYPIGSQFYCADTRTTFQITEIHSDGCYMAQPLANHYVFDEMEYLYPAMKYRQATVERMVSIGYWKEVVC